MTAFDPEEFERMFGSDVDEDQIGFEEALKAVVNLYKAFKKLGMQTHEAAVLTVTMIRLENTHADSVGDSEPEH